MAKELQRQGVARTLINELEALCKSGGIRKILPGCARGKCSGKDTYVKTGFVEDGIRQRFYDNPMEDAILMSRPVEAGQDGAGEAE